MSDGPRILIAASGTGGHLLPAVYVAGAIRRLAPDARIEFVGAGRPLEEKIIGGAGYRLHTVSFSGVKHQGVRGLIRTALKFPSAVLGINRILREFSPHAIIGVGGYVSVLPVMLGRMKGIPTWIHEAELQPGLANAFLARFATKISVAFPGTKIGNESKVVVSGQPVRPELEAFEDTLELASGEVPRRLLVVGGSQGARAIDDAVVSILPLLKERGIEVHHQSRPENVERLTAAYAEAGVPARVVGFIEDMPAAYSWSELIVGRAGAGTVMEIGIVNRPTLFVPYPFVKHNHQAENARTLVEQGKAVLEMEGEGFHERFRAAFEKISEPSVYGEMRSKPVQSRGRNAADSIGKGVLELVGYRSAAAVAA